MASIQTFDQLYQVVNTLFPGQPIQRKGDGRANLHLYHAANSICSQKVRAVLFATGQPFISHPIDIFKGETYDPNYVRLRLTGCNALGLPLVTSHTGSTSASNSGCDACVVPTIVVEDSSEVLVDSKRICIELDRRNPAAPNALLPHHLKTAIEDEMSIVDDLPNFQLFLAAMAKPGAHGPDKNIVVGKIQRCNRMITQNGGDAALCSAYAAKRAKEQAAADRLFDATAIDRAKRRIETAICGLDVRLQKCGGRYLFGASLTLADLFWGVELLRVEDLGMSSLWSNGKLPTLETYFRRLCENSALDGAITQWPGAKTNKK